MDIPKDIQFNKGIYKIKNKLEKKLNGALSNKINLKEVDSFIEMIKKSSKPIFYTGGGVINSGPRARSINWFSYYLYSSRFGSLSSFSF